MLRIVMIPAVALLFLCPAYSQQPHAVLRSNGQVKINGTPTNSSTVVMDGDRIETDEHSSAFLMLPGRMITVGAGSSVVYKNGTVVPTAGAAKVTTASCQGSNCTTSSALLGKGEVKRACDDGEKGNADAKDDKDCHPKKKCISPKKPKKDKDCDDDRDDDHHHD
jgi:hypothetical protein